MSLQICDIKYSELIPCLDRNLIYQLKLKPNLAVMEHYERHCPPPERRYNCIIPPPKGYKVGDGSFLLKLRVGICVVSVSFDTNEIASRISDPYKMACK